MSAAPGRPQGSHGVDRKQNDYDAFADQCAAKAAPLSVFYPERGNNTRAAKKLCMPCPVRQQCVDYALKYDERYGIWGGLSETERRAVKRARRSQATS